MTSSMVGRLLPDAEGGTLRGRELLLSAVLITPVFLYLGARLLLGYQGWTGASVLGFVVIPALLVLGLFGPYGALGETLGYLGVAALATLATLLDAFGAAGYDFAAGLLLSTPFLLGAWAWRPSRSAPARLLGLGLGLTEGLMLLAALSYLSTAALAENSFDLFSAYAETNLLQLCGLSGLLGIFPGGCASFSAFPLQDLVDPVFVLLGGLALVGTLLPVLVPRTATGERAVEADEETYRAGFDVRPGTAVSPEMVAGLSRRTPPQRFPGPLPPGAGAFLAAAMLAFLFVIVAVDDASGVLLPTLLLLLVALPGILYLSRPSPELRRARLPAVEAAARSAAPRATPPSPSAAPEMPRVPAPVLP